MLVKELIKELKKLDPNKEIEVRNSERYWWNKIESIKPCKVFKDSFWEVRYCFNDFDVKEASLDWYSLEEQEIKYIID